jgi:hypothetical protein
MPRSSGRDTLAASVPTVKRAFSVPTGCTPEGVDPRCSDASVRYGMSDGEPRGYWNLGRSEWLLSITPWRDSLLDEKILGLATTSQHPSSTLSARIAEMMREGKVMGVLLLHAASALQLAARAPNVRRSCATSALVAAPRMCATPEAGAGEGSGDVPEQWRRPTPPSAPTAPPTADFFIDEAPDLAEEAPEQESVVLEEEETVEEDDGGDGTFVLKFDDEEEDEEVIVEGRRRRWTRRRWRAWPPGTAPLC